MSTPEPDLRGRVSRSRRGSCRAGHRNCTSQATFRVEHAGAACEPNPRLRPSTSLAALTLFALPARQGWLPAIFDERVVPLTGLEAPLPSFPFVDPDYALQPPPRMMRQFVMVLVARFRMSVAEIVVAYALVGPHPHRNHTPTTRTHHPQPVRLTQRPTLHATNQVERALLLHPTLLHCHSVRPIFLGCCALAVKMTCDCELHTSLSSLHSRVKDLFNLLELELLARIERQLLEVLGSQPAPVTSQRLALAPLPPSPRPTMRCRCWTGGCPWGEGIINRTPTRSSARQRTRSTRRPTLCRPHRSFFRGNRRCPIVQTDLSEYRWWTTCYGATMLQPTQHPHMVHTHTRRIATLIRRLMVVSVRRRGFGCLVVLLPLVVLLFCLFCLFYCFGGFVCFVLFVLVVLFVLAVSPPCDAYASNCCVSHPAPLAGAPPPLLS